MKIVKIVDFHMKFATNVNLVLDFMLINAFLVNYQIAKNVMKMNVIAKNVLMVMDLMI